MQNICGRLSVVVVLGWSCGLGRPVAIAADSLGGDAALRRAAESALDRGCSWLLRQQAADGGWHSTTYGRMRGGAGNTALAVYALSGAWPALSAEEQSQVRHGVRFLATNLDPSGFVRSPDGSSDYPTYATALAVIAIDRAKLPEFVGPQKEMRRYLAAVQVRPRREKGEDDPDLGGWGQTGGDPQDLGSRMSPNISVTRFALEALQGSTISDNDAIKLGLQFVSRLQNRDSASADHGGFHFTSLPDDPLNKAGWLRDDRGSVQTRAYGTTTADGLCALLAGGVAAEDARVQFAIAWLNRRQELESVPGIPGSDPRVSGNRQALRFYYYASLARAIERASVRSLSQRLVPLTEQIIAFQRPDGSWSNPSQLMSEDDPLVASALAVESLGAVLRAAGQ